MVKNWGSNMQVVRKGHGEIAMTESELVRSLLALMMNFVDAFKTDFYVLQGKDKGHELLDGRVELANDVLRGKHHTERNVAVDDCRGGKDGDEDIF